MLRNWPIFLLAAVLVVILGVSCYTDPSYQDKQNGAGNSPPTTSVTQTETGHPSQETQTTKHPPRGWRKLFVWPEGVTALAILLTLFFIGWQALLTRQAIASADSASRLELRAYVGVTVGTGCFQDRDKGIKFEATPTLTNTGKTPAHKVRYRANAAALREPLPDNYVFAPGQNDMGEYIVGVNNPMIIHIVVDDYCDQQDVASIMAGTDGRALYCWGKITYEDVFGDRHETDFCHRLFFYPDGDKPETFRVGGTYLPGRNKAT
jgi:hypothetical protein